MGHYTEVGDALKVKILADIALWTDKPKKYKTVKKTYLSFRLRRQRQRQKCLSKHKY